MTHPEAIAFTPKTIFSRREFVMTTLAGGFAAAVLPVSAQTIATDAKGLTAGEVKIAVSDGEMPAYRAQPEGGKNLPVVLVVQEIFGVHEHIKDVCRRFAKAGYLAVAPELYARQGDPTQYKEIKDLIEKVVSKVPDLQVMADLDATAAWAAKNGGNADKMAVTGFCWGGRITWMYAAHNPKLKAGVAWYGGLVRPATPLSPKHPIDIAATLKVPVLGLYGGADTGIPNETVEQMRAALAAAKNPSEIQLYPDTPHGFHADYRPSYRKEQAEDGWKRLLAWFKKYGVA
ncbi:MAG: dienelactone hydrolase family protein [Betaproteobacteria bacterium]|nr:dienelactone hydrolase family protein [Betaproteobacteria bacterium]